MAEPDIRDAELTKLRDTALVLAQTHDDIRGRKVVDRNGNAIGTVADLFIDEEHKRVRMMQVRAGGFLGIGDRHYLLPIDVITSFVDGIVHVDATREHVLASPIYDPHLVDGPSRGAWGTYYGYYGIMPYWSAGYMYPELPMSQNFPRT
jgi:sporulation protein YlmC with PRC-barrel domain